MDSLISKRNIVRLVLGLFIILNLVIGSPPCYAAGSTKSKGEDFFSGTPQSLNPSQRSLCMQTVAPFAKRMHMLVQVTEGKSLLRIVTPPRGELKETMSGFFTNLNYFSNFSSKTMDMMARECKGDTIGLRKYTLRVEAELLRALLTRLYQEDHRSYKSVMGSSEMAAFMRRTKIDPFGPEFIKSMSTTRLEKKKSSSSFGAGLSFKTLLCMALLPVAGHSISVVGSITGPGSLNPDSTVNISGPGNYTESFNPGTVPSMLYYPDRGPLSVSIDVSSAVSNFTGSFSLGSYLAGTYSFDPSDYTTPVGQLENARYVLTTVPMSSGPIVFEIVPSSNYCTDQNCTSSCNWPTLLYTIEDSQFGATGGIELRPICRPSNSTNSSSSSSTGPGGSTGGSSGGSSSSSGLSRDQTVGLAVGIPAAGLVGGLIFKYCTYRKDRSTARAAKMAIQSEHPEVLYMSEYFTVEIPRLSDKTTKFRKIWGSPGDLTAAKTFVSEVKERVTSHIRASDAPQRKLGADRDTWNTVARLALGELTKNEVALITYRPAGLMACLFGRCMTTYQTPNYQVLISSKAGALPYVDATVTAFIQEVFSEKYQPLTITTSRRGEEGKDRSPSPTSMGSPRGGDDVELTTLPVSALLASSSSSSSSSPPSSPLPTGGSDRVDVVVSQGGSSATSSGSEGEEGEAA